MTDVLLFDGPDGGDIEYLAGRLTMTDDGFDVAVYLSWFGGNEEDSGRTEHDRKQWWGNVIQPSPAHQYRSETQWIIQGLPLTSENLRKVEGAAARDIEWMVSGGYASSITATVRLVDVDEIELFAKAVMPDETIREFQVRKKWGKEQ